MTGLKDKHRFDDKMDTDNLKDEQEVGSPMPSLAKSKNLPKFMSK